MAAAAVDNDKDPAVRIHVVRDLPELDALGPAWQTLARDAADPNAFCEPWFVLPALRHWKIDRNLLFLFMYTEDPDRPGGPPLLCALVPFVREKRFRGLPCGTLRLLKPPYGELCTPLVHKDFTVECARALLDWLERSPDSDSLVEFRIMTGEGRVAQELHQQTDDRRWTVFQSESRIRALLRPSASAETYLEHALRGRRRKELRRLENRLNESGPIEYRHLKAGDDAAPWIAQFLDLESRGWKGREGTSIASQPEGRRFFEEAATDAHKSGQLMMLGLFQQEKPIALKCNFLSGHGAFAFKIAFDEEYARYSPGVLLEMENVRAVHRMPHIAWMDSTAASEHFMINRLWTDRRTVETLLVSPRRAWGSFIVASFPLLRWLRSSVRPRNTPLPYRQRQR